MTSRPRTRVSVQAPFGGVTIAVLFCFFEDQLTSLSPKNYALPEVMAGPVISISSDSSEESVGSHVPRVILSGTIPTNIPVIPVVPAEVPIAPADPLVAPRVGAVSVISPTRVLDLVDYSSSFDSDPSEDSLHVAPELPLVSPFLCSDDSEADSESDSEQRPERNESLTPSSQFPLAPIVGPFLARRLAWRRVSHRSSDHHSSPYFTSHSSSSSSSSDSSLDISSGSSLDSLSDLSSVHSSGHSHSGPSTRVASPRLVDPPSSPDSSFERSLDSSSPSAGLSRKRCRSLATLVPSSTPVSRLIAPALANLPPRKSFRDSYSSEVSGEEYMEIGTADVETVSDLGISKGVRAHTENVIYFGFEVATSDIREDEEDFEAEASEGGTMEIAVDSLATGDISEPTGGDAPNLEGTFYDVSHYMFEVPLDRITEFETAQRQLEAGQLEASRERELEEFRQVHRNRDDTQRRLRRIMTNTRSGMTPTAIEEMINRRVTKALETREANRNIRLGNGNNEGGNGNGNGNGNGSGIHNENDRYARPVVRECTYQDFMKCQPLNLKGTEGVVGLIRWFEKMETIFHISNCPEKYKVKYATCTLLNSALTWWNSHKRTIGADAAFAMSWRELIKLMDEVYYPRTKIQKMESELCNLTMKNNDLAAYTQRFQDLTMLCTKMVPEEE
ncbi:putative reverse transcriptase domain-containing protein, partial [Tanacetum coccineum]